MIEAKPDSPQDQEQFNIRKKDFARFLRRHCLIRNVTNLGVKTSFYIFMISSESGREFIKKYGLKEALFSAESKAGFLEDSILSNNLYFPNDQGTSLTHKQAVVGRWVGFDFNRPKEFGQKFRGENFQMKKGRLMAFSLEEVLDKSINEYTPTNLLNVLNIYHILQLEFPSIEDLLSYGFIRKTTYSKAYDQVGLLDKYKQYLTLAGLLDTEIYSITPKGNGLVGLSSDFGQKTKEPQKEKEFKPAFSF